MATASDAFTRADAVTLGANWTTPAGADLGITSNAVSTTNGGARNIAYWSANTFTADQFSQATFIAAANVLWTVNVRQAAAAVTYYGWGYDANDFNTNLRLLKYSAGVATSLYTEATTLSANDVLKLEVSGTTLIGYLNGVNKTGSITDATIATGQPGMLLFHTVTGVALLDTWSGGDLSTFVSSFSKPLWPMSYF